MLPLFGDADYATVGDWVVKLITAAGVFYAIIRTQRRSDVTQDDERDQSMAAVFRKDRDGLLGRLSKELVFRDKLEQRIEALEKENLECRKTTLDLQAQINVLRKDKTPVPFVPAPK